MKNQENYKSKLVDRVLGENHNIQTIKLLKHVHNYHEFNVNEAIEISKNKNNSLNWNLSFFYKIID